MGFVEILNDRINNSQGEKKMRVIKRYANRKLYDTNESRYVTLEQLAQLVATGERLHVLDKATDKDLTVQTLAQIVFEQQKDRPSVDVPVLENLIKQSSGKAFTGKTFIPDRL